MTSSPIRFEFIPSTPSNTNTTTYTFSQSTLICSIPSVGNVGQLAADYLITNMPVCCRIGYISCPLILPVVGNDPFSHSHHHHHQEDREHQIGQLHLSAEVYHLKTEDENETGNENDKNKSYFLIQIRSPIMQHARFAQLFMRWVRDQQFSRCLILASANASWRMDSLLLETISTAVNNDNNNSSSEREEVLVGTTSSHLLQRAPRINIRYKMTSSSSTNLSDNDHDDEKSGASSSRGANKNAWEDSSLVKVVPPMNHSMSTSSSVTSGENDANNDNDHVEVGVVHSEEEQKFLTGLRRELIEQAQEQGVHACMLLVLCNEGDNIPHGVFLAEVVALHVLFAGDVHPMRQVKWRMPSSWRFLYGPPPSSSLY